MRVSIFYNNTVDGIVGAYLCRDLFNRVFKYLTKKNTSNYLIRYHNIKKAKVYPLKYDLFNVRMERMGKLVHLFFFGGSPSYNELITTTNSNEVYLFHSTVIRFILGLRKEKTFFGKTIQFEPIFKDLRDFFRKGLHVFPIGRPSSINFWKWLRKPLSTKDDYIYNNVSFLLFDAIESIWNGNPTEDELYLYCNLHKLTISDSRKNRAILHLEKQIGEYFSFKRYIKNGKILAQKYKEKYKTIYTKRIQKEKYDIIPDFNLNLLFIYFVRPNKPLISIKKLNDYYKIVCYKCTPKFLYKKIGVDLRNVWFEDKFPVIYTNKEEIYESLGYKG